jgi:hypothetical protein
MEAAGAMIGRRPVPAGVPFGSMDHASDGAPLTEIQFLCDPAAAIAINTRPEDTADAAKRASSRTLPAARRVESGVLR